MDYASVDSMISEECRRMAQDLSRHLALCSPKYKQPDFPRDNQWISREEEIYPAETEYDITGRTFLRASMLVQEYGAMTVPERMLAIQSVHREHDTIQRMNVSLGCHDLNEVNLALLDLYDRDPGVPSRRVLAVHHSGVPVFLATYDLGITTMFSEPQLAADTDFDQEWKAALDSLWQDYLAVNPLKTHEDFSRSYKYR